MLLRLYQAIIINSITGVIPSVINSLAPGRCSNNFKTEIFPLISCIEYLGVFYKIVVWWMLKTPLMIRHHWFWWWLGVVRQQAIAWTKVVLDLCRYMASLVHTAASWSSGRVQDSGLRSRSSPGFNTLPVRLLVVPPSKALHAALLLSTQEEMGTC